MQYLIGEIGLSIIAAGLIGLLVGWLISRFFKSRTAAHRQRLLVEDIDRRDNEIHRLQSDLRYAREGHTRDFHDRNMTDGRARQAQGDASYAVAAKGMRSDTAALRISGDADGRYGQPRRLAEPTGGQKRLVPPRGARRQACEPDARPDRRPETQPDTRANEARRPSSSRADSRSEGVRAGKEKDLHAALDGERHQKVQAFAAAGERETDLKKRLDNEAYEKIQAFAKLGEKDREIVGIGNARTASDLSASNYSNDSKLHDYQQLLDQKNTQVDQLQQKIRELLALRRQPVAQPASVRAPQQDGASKERERVLKLNIEEETFAKVQAIAALGEAERKLELAGRKQSVDPGMAPLRRRAEQQDAIILDLRKRIEIQQNQSNVMQQEFDRKLRGREADFATMKAEFSAGSDSASQAEVDSYRRKLSEAERAHQSRIKDFNTTLEARNREYDELGKRLEDLRGKINQKDSQLTELKAEYEKQAREKSTLEVNSNKWREELGNLKIAVDEKESNIVSLKSRAVDMERSSSDVREMESQLAEFTKSTEASAKKFEGVILEQRTRLEASEQEIARLKALNTKRENELEEQLVTLRKTAKDSENKKETLLADTNRYRSQQNAKDAQITQLNKDIKVASASTEQARQDIKRLEVVAKETDILSKKLSDKQAEQQRLQQQLETARTAHADAAAVNKKALQAKDNEISRISADLSTMRQSFENEKGEVNRFKKEVEVKQSNVLQLSKKYEEESKKQQDKISVLEPLRLKLNDSENKVESLQKEHKLALTKSADDVRGAREQLAKLEKSAAEQIGAKEKELTDLRAKTKELHTLRSDLSLRDSKIATLNTDLDKLSKQKGEYDNEIARLSKEIDTSKTEASGLKKKLEAGQQSLGAKNSELEKVRASVADNEARLTTLRAETQTARDGDKKAVTELQGKLDVAAKTHQQEIGLRDKQLGELKHKLQALDALREENTKYTNELNALNVKLAEANKTAEANRQEVSQLKKTIDDARVVSAREKENFNAELRRAKEQGAQVETLRKQSDSYQSQIQGLKKDVQEKSDQYHQRIKELEPWQQKFKVADQQARDHQASIVKLKADTSADLEQKLSLATKQNNELLTQRDKRIADLDQKVKTLDSLRQEIAQRDKKLADLNTEIAQARKQTSDFENRFKTAEQQAKAHESSLTALKAEYSTKGSQQAADVERTRKEISALQEQQKSLESKHAATIKENNAAIERFKQQIADGEKKAAESAKKLNDARSRWDAETAEAKKSHESKLATLQNDHKTELQSQRSKAEKSTGEVQSLQSKISQLEPLQAKLTSAQTEARQLQEANKAASGKHATELSSLQSRVKELEQLQAKLTTQEIENKKLQEQQKTAADKYASELTALQNRVKEIEPLQKRLSLQEAEYNRLQESRKAAVEKSAAELGVLQARVKEIEPLQRKLSQSEAEHNKLKDTQRAVAEKSSGEINSLHARVRELEPLQAKLSSAESEAKRLQEAGKAAGEKHAVELSSVQSKVKELEPLQGKLTSQEAENKRFQEQQKAATDKASAEVKSLQGRLRELEPLQQKLTTSTAEYRKLEEAHKAATDKASAEMSALQTKLSAQESENKRALEAQKAATDKSSAEIALLQGRVRDLEPLQKKLQKFSSLEQEVEAQNAAVVDLKKRLAEREEALKQLAALEKQLAAGEKRFEDEVGQKDSSIAALKLEIERLKREPAPEKPKPAAKPAAKKAVVTADGKKTTRKDGMDDLKLIFGIGPKIETMLNAEGVKHFEDIANWNKADVARYSDMLDGFPDRIERDEWVLSARQIIDGTYNWEERRKAREVKSSAAKPVAAPAKVATPVQAKATVPVTKRTGLTADGKKTTRRDGMDDLKLIFGIGAKIEKMLNRKGVKSFEDIAGWTKADVQRYSEMLDSFPDRIERDEWVQSAKEIIAGTYNWAERKSARQAKK